MKNCKVRPYDGERKYIYLAYSLKDKRYVYPIIEQLAKDGYRVWYDDGAVSGPQSAEKIAEKIARCDMFLGMFSESTADSYTFKREVNFAILNEKEMIAVFLQQVHLSPGMELQLAAYPAIFKYKLDDGSFFKTLYSFEIMHQSRGNPDSGIVVSDENEYKENLFELYGIDDFQSAAPDDLFFFKVRQKNEKEANMPKAVLTKLTTNEDIEITTPKMVIGRGVSEKIKPVIDYSIETNSMVSRLHAVIVFKNNEFYLIDCGAVNKTFLNGEELEINVEYLLHDGDTVKIANELFRFRRIEVL